eukprot:760348-Hanusia_phi.AAC.16
MEQKGEKVGRMLVGARERRGEGKEEDREKSREEERRKKRRDGSREGRKRKECEVGRATPAVRAHTSTESSARRQSHRLLS